VEKELRGFTHRADKEKKADVYSAKHARLQEQALANSKNKPKSNK